MNKTLAALSVLTLLLAGAANARNSQPSELRGFDTCVDTAKAEFALGFVAKSTYFIDHSASGNTYFINASAWQDGDRALLRISCETSANGRDLLAYNAAPGRFVPQQGKVTIQVAGTQ